MTAHDMPSFTEAGPTPTGRDPSRGKTAQDKPGVFNSRSPFKTFDNPVDIGSQAVLVRIVKGSNGTANDKGLMANYHSSQQRVPGQTSMR